MGGRMSQHPPIRVGIAGFGRSGCDIHAKALARIPEPYTVNTVLHPLPARQTGFPQPGLVARASFEELNDDPDIELVVVASPNKWHARQVRAALAAGKHVLCEK